MTEGERLWGVREMAEYLDITPATVRYLARAGKIPGVQVGIQWRFSRQVYDQWFKSLALQNVRREEET